MDSQPIGRAQFALDVLGDSQRTINSNGSFIRTGTIVGEAVDMDHIIFSFTEGDIAQTAGTGGSLDG